MVLRWHSGASPFFLATRPLLLPVQTTYFVQPGRRDQPAGSELFEQFAGSRVLLIFWPHGQVLRGRRFHAGTFPYLSRMALDKFTFGSPHHEDHARS